MSTTRRRRRCYADRYKRIGDPWIEGFTAASQSLSWTSNPYADNTDFAQLWTDGWREAVAECDQPSKFAAGTRRSQTDPLLATNFA
ncbi:MAG TPA: hypothetical protein VMD30_10085 [Tepidisphaeraceae bacterium]|nr:hypothetical protein [Tepidisphaeraceae bacterium]